jgi:hypothetical protein
MTNLSSEDLMIWLNQQYMSTLYKMIYSTNYSPSNKNMGIRQKRRSRHQRKYQVGLRKKAQIEKMKKSLEGIIP